jgi:hypothetical protein
MRPLTLLAFFLFAGLFYTCAKPLVAETQEPDDNLHVPLYQCMPVSLTAEASVCFDSLLSDSRCPVGGVCVWMGVAYGKFSLSANGTRYPFRLSTIAQSIWGPRDTVVAGFKIELINFSPYPGTVADPVPDNIRKAELKVTKL